MGAEKITNLFKNLEEFLRNDVLSSAAKMDTNSACLSSYFEKIIQLGSLKLLIPISYGGFGGSRLDWANYNILLAQFSGALLFLQAQHQFSISRLNLLLEKQDENESIKTILNDIAINNTS